MASVSILHVQVHDTIRSSRKTMGGRKKKTLHLRQQGSVHFLKSHLNHPNSFFVFFVLYFHVWWKARTAYQHKYIISAVKPDGGRGYDLYSLCSAKDEHLCLSKYAKINCEAIFLATRAWMTTDCVTGQWSKSHQEIYKRVPEKKKMLQWPNQSPDLLLCESLWQDRDIAVHKPRWTEATL